MSLEKVKIDSGLTIYNDYIDGARTNDVAVFVPYGSLDEQPGDEGAAHVFEHCLHLQTDKFEDEIALERYGRLNGMRTNATTSYTHTLYYASGAALEPSMTHLSQVLQHSHLPEDKVKSALKAVRREMTTKLDSIDRVHGVARTNAMVGLPYGRCVGGYHDKIDFDVDALEDLHDRYYKLSRMALVVSGAAKTDEVVALASQLFEADDSPTFTDRISLPQTHGEHKRTGLVRDDSSSVRVSVGHPMSAEFREQYNNNRLAYGMAMMAINDACFRTLRHDKAISYDGSMDFLTHNHPNAWSISGNVTTDAKDVDTALTVFSDVLQRDSSRYDNDDLQGTVAMFNSGLNSDYLDGGARSDQHISRLASYREPESIDSVMRRLDQINVAGVRVALDEIVEFVGSTDRYVHLTGPSDAIGEIDRIIEQSEVA